MAGQSYVVSDCPTMLSMKYECSHQLLMKSFVNFSQSHGMHYVKPTKACSFCQKQKLLINFKLNEETGLGHAFCHDCRHYLEQKQYINWLHYFNPSIYKHKVI
ncbi:hypothetical protein [Escherichia phage 4E8]|nr:hypothetical protein [Escherichia phage 4E8]